jgi:hypothetical protein
VLLPNLIPFNILKRQPEYECLSNPLPDDLHASESMLVFEGGTDIMLFHRKLEHD